MSSVREQPRWGADRTGAARRGSIPLARWSVPILAYHRVGEPRRDHVPTVTPEAFTRQLQWIQRLGFRVCDFGDILLRIARHAPIDRRSVVITFDDGYEETYSVVAPLLNRFGYSATVFVTPEEVGQPGFLTWQQVRAIAREGMVVGSHTMHHTYLPMVSLAYAEQELRDSKHALEQILQQPTRWLSYPIGGYTRDIQHLARAVGYEGACTTNRGNRRSAYDLFALRRIRATERDQHPLMLWAKLCGYYDTFRRLEQPA